MNKKQRKDAYTCDACGGLGRDHLEQNGGVLKECVVCTGSGFIKIK